MLTHKEKEKLKSLWQGRVEHENGSCRWHQRVCLEEQKDYMRQLVLAGFASDEGVCRNQGRVGAIDGPSAIRAALANLSCDETFTFYDAGDVVCVGDKLEEAQTEQAQRLSQILQRQGMPIVLGGGHEVAFPSFTGMIDALALHNIMKPRVGIINFDAHFDLRDPINGANSGTPFRQCQALCQQKGIDFNYCVLGINASSNSQALFEFARQHSVSWQTDEDLVLCKPDQQFAFLRKFLAKCDYIYLTICLDVFSHAYAPGVSAPAAVGIHPLQGLQWMRAIFDLCKQESVTPVLCDIAEMNPRFDLDNQTAKLAARFVFELAAMQTTLQRDDFPSQA